MMGAQLVAATYTNWRHLTDKPFRLLVHMSLTCLDTDKQPTYYGGRDAMAEALGAKADSAGWQSAHRCVALLVASGAIERKMFGHAGKRSEYALNVRKRPEKVVTQSIPSQAPKGVTESMPQGVTQSNSRVSLSDSNGCHSVTPLGTTDDPTNDHKRKNSSSNKGESPSGARADAKQGKSELTEWEKQRRARQIAKAREKRVSPLDELKAQRAGGATA